MTPVCANAYRPACTPGSAVHQALLDDPELDEEIARICVDILRTDKDKHRRSVGSLGGGNHFIEIAQGDRDAFLCIHSGSRNFGLKIAEHYQKLATATCPNEYLVQRKKGLCYLEGENTLNYMRDMKVAQRFAALNRRVMLHELMDNAEELESFDTVHNYIAEDNIIRKGAVQASAGCKLIVPLNMRDGSVICIGKGNEEYNNSSPHGAGRKMSRKKAKSSISLEEFETSMQGIFSTCVSRATLDEAPMAYKDGDSVLDNIHETAEIVERLRPYTTSSRLNGRRPVARPPETSCSRRGPGSFPNGVQDLPPGKSACRVPRPGSEWHTPWRYHSIPLKKHQIAGDHNTPPPCRWSSRRKPPLFPRS